MSWTAADAVILRADIFEPLEGRWHADLELDTETDQTGSITLSLGAVSFTGTVHRGGVEQGRWIGRIVGGAAGLSTELDAKAYRSVFLESVLGDLMTDSGETLSSTSDTLSGTLVAHWQRQKAPASHTLWRLAEAVSLSWRVLRDGTIWLGTDAFAALEADFVQLNDEPALGVRTVAPAEDPTILPGVSIGGVSVRGVYTMVRPDAVRQELWA